MTTHAAIRYANGDNAVGVRWAQQVHRWCKAGAIFADAAEVEAAFGGQQG